MSGDWDSDLSLALEMADVADRVSMAHYLQHDLQVSTKPDSSPVTEADTATERALRDLLAERRPDDGLLGEEFGTDPTTGDRRWIIDPIDGTKNYLRGVPVWSTLIALESDEELVVGVASAPALGRRWWASRGAGAYTRDVDGSVRRLSVSGIGDLASASFSFSDEEWWLERGALSGLRSLIEDTWRSRAYGDFLSHVLVAEGAVDIAAEPALAPWDMAALVPIVEEAGGRITAFDGGPALTGHCAVSTNGHLHDVTLRLLRTPAPNE